MLNGYHILTLTHRNAALEIIGNAILRSDEPGQALQALKARFGWDELLCLNTCNRVMYLFYSPVQPSCELSHDFIAAIRPDLSPEAQQETADKMLLIHGADAVRHLLEVASSMDSLVIGEREIIRQLRESYDTSLAYGLTGDHLRILMRFTVETAKEVYTTTGIGEKALSVVALAFNQLLQTGLPTHARILLVGAGQTNTLVAKFLVKYGYRNVTVFNRTLEKARGLADHLQGRALPLDALEYYTEGFDALIVCTGATEPIISPALYHRLLVAESNHKVVVDLSVPNNVDKRIPATFPVHFIEIESLREVASENLSYRESERQKADVLLNGKMHQFRELWHQRQVERSLAPFVDEVRAAKSRAVESVFAKELTQLDPASQELVQRMLGYMEKKTVAIAMRTMKEVAASAQRYAASERSKKPVEQR